MLFQTVRLISSDILTYDTKNTLVEQVLQKRKKWQRYCSSSAATPQQESRIDLQMYTAPSERKHLVRVRMKSIQKIRHKHGLFTFLNQIHYPYMPETWISLKEWDQHHHLQREAVGGWFVKLSYLSCGVGIHVCRSAHDVHRAVSQLQAMHELRQKERGGNCKTAFHYVIQRQVERPLLFQGAKCDFRVYLYIDSFHRVSLCKTVGVRVCLFPYRAESQHPRVQLTNVSQGALIFPSSQWDRKQPLIKWNLIFAKIQEAVVTFAQALLTSEASSSSSSSSRITRNRFRFCLYGLDFILTETLMPCLLEINDRPCLGNCEFQDWEHAQQKLVNDCIKHLIEPVLLGTSTIQKSSSSLKRNTGDWIQLL